MRRCRFLIYLLFLVNTTYAQEKTFFNSCDLFIKNFVVEGKVNYQGIIETGSDSLNDLIEKIGKMELEGEEDAFKKAFYINAYNLLVINAIVGQYPISSPLTIEGFFKEKKHLVAGQQVTLDQLEFDILFKDHKDIRLHFVLNCGAKSCPTLFSGAIFPQLIESQLQFSATMVMDRDDFVHIDHENDRIWVSRIFEWYRDMFEEDSGSIRTFVDDNRFESLPAGYEIHFLEYDWSLNSL